MDIRDIEARYHIKVESGSVLVRRLRGQVKRFERKYEIPSTQMLRRVRSRQVPETREIGQWMQAHLVLGRIDETRARSSRKARLEHSRKLPTHL